MAAGFEFELSWASAVDLCTMAGDRCLCASGRLRCAQGPQACPGVLSDFALDLVGACGQVVVVARISSFPLRQPRRREDVLRPSRGQFRPVRGQSAASRQSRGPRPRNQDCSSRPGAIHGGVRSAVGLAATLQAQRRNLTRHHVTCRRTSSVGQYSHSFGVQATCTGADGCEDTRPVPS